MFNREHIFKYYDDKMSTDQESSFFKIANFFKEDFEMIESTLYSRDDKGEMVVYDVGHVNGNLLVEIEIKTNANVSGKLVMYVNGYKDLIIQGIETKYM